MEWFDAVEKLREHVVQISTPQGGGTGFFVARANAAPAICAVATAAHVVDHAQYWEEPIRVRSAATGEVLVLRQPQRSILLDEKRDTAVVVFDEATLTLPKQPPRLVAPGQSLKVGNAIGWLGFPAIPGADLCFFRGTISAWLPDHSAYFVDGVAINGVSGGPAFCLLGESILVIGVVSAYMPNRATGETLPGLGIVRDVSQFHDVVQHFRSVDEAKAKETPAVEPPATAAPSDLPGRPTKRPT